MTSWNPDTSPLGHYVASSDATDARKKARDKCQLVLEHLYDSYNGYKACAEDCKEIVPKILFEAVAETRSDFIAQLSSVIRTDFGLEPVTSGSGLAAVHRWWVDVKAWFTEDGDKAAIVSAIHRGEIHLIQQYKDALSEHELLTNKVSQVLLEQLKTILEEDATVYDL